MENTNVNEPVKKKKNTADYIVAAIVLISMIIIYFFWGCWMDLPVTVLCVLVVLFSTWLLVYLRKKLNKKLEGEVITDTNFTQL